MYEEGCGQLAKNKIKVAWFCYRTKKVQMSSHVKQMVFENQTVHSLFWNENEQEGNCGIESVAL